MTEPRPFPRRAFPCSECPWRLDSRAGQFSAARYEALKKTSTSPSITDPMFGCHKGAPGTDEDLACAGWLAVAGNAHPAARLAVAAGRLDSAALRPGPGWPGLFSSYDEMAQAQGSPDEPEET